MEVIYSLLLNYTPLPTDLFNDIFLYYKEPTGKLFSCKIIDTPKNLLKSVLSVDCTKLVSVSCNALHISDIENNKLVSTNVIDFQGMKIGCLIDVWCSEDYIYVYYLFKLMKYNFSGEIVEIIEEDPQDIVTIFKNEILRYHRGTIIIGKLVFELFAYTCPNFAYDDDYIFITGLEEKILSVFDRKDSKLVYNIDTPSMSWNFYFGMQITVNPISKKLYMSSLGKVYKLDYKTHSKNLECIIDSNFAHYKLSCIPEEDKIVILNYNRNEDAREIYMYQG